MIKYGCQNITDEDIQAVVRTLKSDFLTQGEMVPQFERDIMRYTSANYAVAVNSATSALHIACRALGLKKGDWLWTTPVTFVSSANCGLFCDANIDLVDINPLDWNMSAQALEEKLVIANKKRVLPKVVVIVHLCGLPCDMRKIYELSKEYGFSVIEDASHALGGKYDNQPIGSCLYSDVTVFSFHPVKSITTGEGGMAVTNDRDLADKMKLLRNHCLNRNTHEDQIKENEPWLYSIDSLGYNYRMSDIHAALGVSQLTRLDDMIKKRHKIAARYDDAIKELPLLSQAVTSHKYSGMHLYVVRIQTNKTTQKHSQVFNTLIKKGIGVNLHYIPIYKHNLYRKLGLNESFFPESEKFYQEAVTLPIHPLLTSEQQSYVINSLKDIF